MARIDLDNRMVDYLGADPQVASQSVKIFQFSFKIPIYRFNLINETIGGEMLIDEFDCEMKCPPPTPKLFWALARKIFMREVKNISNLIKSR